MRDRTTGEAIARLDRDKVEVVIKEGVTPTDRDGKVGLTLWVDGTDAWIKVDDSTWKKIT